MVGRPIAASHSFITRPISVFVDELVKPIIKMPTVLRDSRELIQILESTELPTHCFLVTADVVSLYPSVDVKKALVALDLLSREVKAPDHETPLLIQLSRLVFENNFLYSKFSTDIVHQDFGLAMGNTIRSYSRQRFHVSLREGHSSLVLQAFSVEQVAHRRHFCDLVWLKARAFRVPRCT